MHRRLAVLLGLTIWLLCVGAQLAIAAPCSIAACPEPEVGVGTGELTAAYVAQTEGGAYLASNAAPGIQPYTYRLLSACSTWTDNDCRPDQDQACESPPERVVRFLVVQQRPVVLPDGTTADGTPVPAGWPVGSPVGNWEALAVTCVDITELNPAPTPDEVFRYFQTLPLPALTTRQQPPGDALVGVPVIFFTDSPTTQTFTVDIRGFTVDIAATAQTFTWHTGDGTAVVSTDPGAPYPHHTVTHDYAAGTYTAYLTTTWGATFSVDGSADAEVPGTTTTDGPPVTFTVLEARAVLTNPYD